MKFLKNVFPFLNWFKGYNRKILLADLFSGATVTVVLIPQVMAYAIIAGLPPVYGLYTSLFGVAIAAMWGSSRQLSTGPVAITSFLVFATISGYAEPNSSEYIALAVFLAILVGLIQFLMGFLKLGFLVSFISHAVIVAFSAAAAIIIAAMQIPNLLGFKIDMHEHIWQNFLEIFKHIPNTHLITFSIGVMSLVIIFTLKKISKKIPAALIVVIFGISITKFFDLDMKGLDIIGNISSQIPFPSLQFVPERTVDLLPAAFIISIVGFLETFAVSKSISRSTKQKTNVNQELIGQGLGNFASSIFQGYPVSGSFSRSAVNFSSGAITGMSSVFVSIFVLVILVFFTEYLYFLPKAVLAAIVISAVMSFVDIKAIKNVFSISKLDGLVLIIVFIASFILKPDVAIFIGIILSLFIFFKISMKTNVMELVYNKYTKRLSSMLRSKGNFVILDNLLMVRIDMPILYINSEIIMEKIISIVEEKKTKKDIKKILISFLGVSYVDSSGVGAVSILVEELKNKNVEVYFVHTRVSIKDRLRKEENLKQIKTFETDEEAFETCRKV